MALPVRTTRIPRRARRPIVAPHARPRPAAHAVPVLVSHVLAFRHMVAPGQVTLTGPAHIPFVHVSGPVQALPSLHDVPLSRFAPPSH